MDDVSVEGKPVWQHFMRTGYDGRIHVEQGWEIGFRKPPLVTQDFGGCEIVPGGSISG
jgi:hypothetical protein